MKVITLGRLPGGTFAAQFSASTRVIDPGARSPNSARNTRSALRVVSMLDALNRRPDWVRSAPLSIRSRNRSTHTAQDVSGPPAVSQGRSVRALATASSRSRLVVNRPTQCQRWLLILLGLVLGTVGAV